MQLPKSIADVVEAFEMLPGIGPKTAQRLAFYLLRLPDDDIKRISTAFSDLKSKTHICKTCFNVSETDYCEICKKGDRDLSQICVVESPLDVLAIEKANYKGVYHVLHGVLNPMAGIGPDEIFLPQFFARLVADTDVIKEIILASGTSLEGESTSMYINREVNKRFPNKYKVTRIGKGLPIGADIEFADPQTLSDAMQGRVLI